jgi:hypothetical protein
MIIIAALLPSVPVIALNYIPSILIKLLFVVAFSFLFSVCLVYFTSATRPDIFAVVTALASVQVVFIGTSTWNDAKAFALISHMLSRGIQLMLRDTRRFQLLPNPRTEPIHPCHRHHLLGGDLPEYASESDQSDPKEW